MGSKASEAPKFDPVMVEAYNKMAENHRHPDGPWIMMRDVVMQHRIPKEAVKDGFTILDLASGPAEPAKTIAAALPHAKVIATDVSEDMVKAAQAATKDTKNVSAAVADAQDLSAYADGSIDAVTCCYGYMFPTDKPQALRETFRVLRPGGLLVATTWDSVDMLKISRDVMTHVLGAAPPPPPLNPMSLSEEGLFASLVADAGFSNVRQTTSTYPFNFGRDKAFQERVGTLLLKEKLDEIGEEGWAKAKEAFWENIDKYTEVLPNGDMVMPQNTFRLTAATKKGPLDA